MSGRETLVLVACVAGKSAHPEPAADMYRSPWFRAARRLAEASGARWFILSAEHGLLAPEAVIAPYERTLNAMSAADRRQWAQRVRARIETEAPEADNVIVLAGARYREHLEPWLRTRFTTVSVPMAGLPIGRQLQWMKHATKL